MIRQLLVLLICCSIGLQASAQQEKEVPRRPSPPKLVTDYTTTLSAREVTALERKLVAYEDSTSTQIAIVIEQSLAGDDAFSYSNRLAQEWGIGQANKDNGILIYMAATDRTLYIQTGYGTEGFLPDAMAKRIIDNVMVPEFKKGNFYAGLNKATDVIIQLGNGEYVADNDETAEYSEDSPVIFFIIAFTIVFIIISNSKRRGGDDDDDGGYYRGGRYQGRRGGGGWIFIPTGGGGWNGGGGSSWNGGGSSGGGFGGFGGGDFGGGGAGGDW